MNKFFLLIMLIIIFIYTCINTDKCYIKQIAEVKNKNMNIVKLKL